VKWFGDKRPNDPPYAEALDAAQRGLPEGEALVHELLQRADEPDLVRATAVSLLPTYPTMESERLRGQSLTDASPAVRAAAVRSLTPESAAQLLQDVKPLLEDPVRVVRMAAATRLVAAAGQLAASEFRGALLSEASPITAG
jgi:hypothetical protein